MAQVFSCRFARLCPLGTTIVCWKEKASEEEVVVVSVWDWRVLMQLVNVPLH